MICSRQKMALALKFGETTVTGSQVRLSQFSVYGLFRASLALVQFELLFKKPTEGFDVSLLKIENLINQLIGFGDRARIYPDPFFGIQQRP